MGAGRKDLLTEGRQRGAKEGFNVRLFEASNIYRERVMEANKFGVFFKP